MSQSVVNIFCSMMSLCVMGGCAATYQGQRPTAQNLSSEQKRTNYDRFQIEERHFFFQGNFAKMNHETYSLDSLRAITKPVSPRSESDFETADSWEIAAYSSIATAIALGIGGFTTKGSTKKGLLIGSLAGSALGFSFVWGAAYHRAAGIKVYNQDLRHLYGME